MAALNDFLYLALFLPLYLAAGLTLSASCRLLQLRRLRQAAGQVFAAGESGGMRPFQAASTALGAAIGTGNVVGTAQALCLGGPGALFWLWVGAGLGMILQYAELLAAQWTGGPAESIRRTLGSGAAWCWSLLCLASILCMGNLAQVHSAAAAVCRSPQALPLFGALLALLCFWAMAGGAARIGKLSAMLVPPMAIGFLLLCLSVVIVHAAALPTVLQSVFRSAFSPRSLLGALHWGVRRAAFSNEAGLGTAALAHSGIRAKDPARYALWGPFQVSVDTLLLCSVTALAILCSGVSLPYGSLPGPELLQSALATLYGPQPAAAAVAAVLLLFGFSTVLSSAAYGLSCLLSLGLTRAARFFPLLFCLLVFIAPMLPSARIWSAADGVNVLLAAPNLLALLIFSPRIGRAARKFLDESA